VKDPSLPSPNYQEIYSKIRDALSEDSPDSWYTPQMSLDLIPLFASTIRVQGDCRILEVLNIDLDRKATRESVIRRFESRKKVALRPRRTREIGKYDKYIVNWDADAVGDLVDEPKTFNSDAAISILKLIYLVIGTCIEFGGSTLEGVLCTIHFNQEDEFFFTLNRHNLKRPINSIVDKRRLIYSILRGLDSTHETFNLLVERLLKLSNLTETEFLPEIFQTEFSGTKYDEIKYRPYSKWTSVKKIDYSDDDSANYDPDTLEQLSYHKNRIINLCQKLLDKFLEELLIYHPLEKNKGSSGTQHPVENRKKSSSNEELQLSADERRILYTVFNTFFNWNFLKDYSNPEILIDSSITPESCNELFQKLGINNTGLKYSKIESSE
jgi:hypothetical protein